MAATQEIGVKAVVKNLNSFISDLGKIDRGLKSLAPSGNLITRAFAAVGSVFSNLGREILNVAEFALGHILGDAIEFVVGKIGELISATIQAGSEFQTMSLRLNRLNLNDIAEAALGYVDAGEAAAKATQEQLKWIQRLAVQTPYDAQDIANVYTLARSYGVADEQARGMTEDIADFAAGMGLGNVEIERIVVNFGQMIQQGKVTQREMNDLARGAFVPVNDVLERMQKNTGLTDQAFKDFRQTGEGVQEFFKAFSQIVEERFQGAAQDMARTFQGATANAQDFVKSLLGMGVVKPVLDAVGGKIADMITSLTTEENWDALVEATGKVGDGLSDLVSTILNGFIPSTGDLAGNIISGLEKFSGWIEEHRPDILGFFQGLSDIISDIAGGVLGISMPKFDVPGAGIGDSMMEIQGNTPKTPQFLEDIRSFINDKVIPAIDNLKKTFDTISGWVDENGPTIKEFFSTLGDIVGQVFEDLSGGGGTKSGESGLDKLLSGITDFMTYVIEHKDDIIPLVENLIKLFTAAQVAGFVFGILFNIVLVILSPLLAFLTIVIGLLGVWTILGPIILSVAGFIVTVLIPGILIGIAVFLVILAVILLVVGIFLLLKFIIKTVVDFIVQKVTELHDQAVEKFTELKDKAITKFIELRDAASVKFQELKDKVIAKMVELVAKIKEKVEDFKNAILHPPFGEWADIGIEIMDGLKRGILSMVQTLIDTIARVAQEMWDAAMTVIGAHSPSRLFMKVGESAMEGMAKGIEEMSGMVAATMEQAVAGMAMPAMNLPAMTAGAASSAVPGVTNSTQNSYNYNLTVNSSAPTEPIVQDYNMMRALAT